MSLSPSELRARLDITVQLASEAGHLAQSLRAEGLEIDHKSPIDCVTQADRAVEAFISSQLTEAFPQDTILGEEGGLQGQAVGVWVIDPIDGTTNYMKGMDYWCVSIAYILDGAKQIGVVFAPDRNEMYAAAKGQGATLNGERLSISHFDLEGLPLIGMGYSERISVQSYHCAIAALLEHGCEYRRFGSGALMLCHVAANQTQGYFEGHLNSWDGAAAVLVVLEAGGEVHGFADGFSLIQGDVILATAPGGLASLKPILI